jgi:hypothetical protein
MGAAVPLYSPEPHPRLVPAGRRVRNRLREFFRGLAGRGGGRGPAGAGSPTSTGPRRPTRRCSGNEPVRQLEVALARPPAAPAAGRFSCASGRNWTSPKRHSAMGCSAGERQNPFVPRVTGLATAIGSALAMNQRSDEQPDPLADRRPSGLLDRSVAGTRSQDRVCCCSARG